MKTRRLTTIIALVVALACALSVRLVYADTGPCGVDNGGALPDFVMDKDRLARSVTIGAEGFKASSCSVQEGFVNGPGKHLLLRFESTFQNVGQGDLVIGDPAVCGNLFESSSCHGHRHFREYADYRLWTRPGYDLWVANRDLKSPTNSGTNAQLLQLAASNGQLVSGRKMGFCMIDTTRVTSDQPAKYTSCTLDQGVSAGWADSYGSRLDGQWIEVDNIKDGEYVLENHVNAEMLLPEADYTNNSAAVLIRIQTVKGKKQASVIDLDP